MNKKVTNVKGYELNVAEGKIVITKVFQKKASVYGSNEYNVLVNLRRDLPDYQIEVKEIKKKENKKSYKGLNIDEMKRFINTRGEEEEQAFEKVLLIAEGKQGKYAMVKKWFLDNYKEIYVPEIETIKIDTEKVA